ncbi:MAG: UPF0182 family protein [Chloroflexi bacterium]|nr:UPF0182 family protein [Chloroflexota bacterium]
MKNSLHPSFLILHPSEVTMAYYRGRREAPQVDWDEVFRRQPPDLRRPLLWGAAFLLLWLLFSIAPRVYTDYRWFEEVGFTSVFWTELYARAAIFFGAALVFFLFYLVNIAIARRLTPRVTDESSRWAQVAAFAGKSITFLLVVAGLVLAFIVGSLAQGNWLAFLRYANAAPFGVSDPIFNQDVAFYVFTLPIYRFLVSWGGGAIVLAALATGATYLMGLGRIQWTNAVKAHLSFLGFLFLLINAWSYQLDKYELVFSARGAIFGANYTDVNAQIPAFNILSILAIVLAILLLVNVFVRALKAIGIAVALWILAAVVLGEFYPGFVQNFEVKPNEFVKEEQYIKHNIALTRQAYALDAIQDAPFPADDAPSPADIQRNADTVNNIRLQDYRPLLQTYNQIQSIRTYYDFSDVDVDRYTIDGKYRQVMISARELATHKLSDKAQTWVNLHLVYTHGYGVAVSPVNEFTADGLPNLLVKDIPPAGVIPVTRPQIYFGEETASYVFVKTREKEFDYPKGDENAFTTYEGAGGVSVGAYWDRLMFALRFGDMNILLTDALTGDSRVLFNRQIQTRVKRVAPFLMLDKDPYPVIADGKIVWIQDAYTSTNNYPYSEPYQRNLNYIRNAVKIAIDAYDGAMTFFVAEPDEPILKAYRAIFPALFKAMDQMPASLRDHLRYPEGLFTIQAAMYRTYHMQDPLVFYNKEDLWAVPNESSGGQPSAMEPYYVIMRLPGDPKEEFMLMLPFVPAKRQNMVAWMSAKSDGADYGKRLVYRFPKDKLVYGPEQIHARLNQDPTISTQLTLLSQRGSRIVWGNLLVIPIEKSLLYIQPMYLLAEQSQIPQLKRVVVATSNNVVMEATLGESLARVFGAGASVITGGAPTSPTAGAPISVSVNELIKRANDQYARAQDALKTSDWATYGKEMQSLQQTLEQLMRAAGQK